MANFATDHVRGKKVIGAQTGGGLLRMQSLGEVFMNPDGTVDLKPVELLPLQDGSIIFRVGYTTYWFDRDGKYEGAEVMALCEDPLYRESLDKMLREARRNIGRAPEPILK
jgi:hypothetical protein